MKLVINTCFGGFGLSEAAYEWLHKERGVPIQKYISQERGEDGRFLPESRNDGIVIFDRELTPASESSMSALYHRYKPNSIGGRYWDCWTRETRDHALVVEVVEALGSEVASGQCAKLKVVEIPDGVEWELDEYDGVEKVREVSRVWA